MPDQFDKWLIDARRLHGGMVNDAAKREAENEQARAKNNKLQGLKDYEKSQQREAAKTVKLREMRLAKEAQERIEAAATKAAPRSRSRRKSDVGLEK
jgi:hypothetical protein